jgi:hypothetical protein
MGINRLQQLQEFQQFAPNLYQQLINYKEKNFWHLFLNFSKQTQVLFLAELHGTNEVPKLAQDLLKELRKDNYSLLALEIPKYHHESISQFLETGKLKDLERGFKGGGNIAHFQTSSHIKLVYEAHHLGYRLGFFGMSHDQPVETDIDRDTHFSNNFLSLWKSFGYPKTVVYCGISHASYDEGRMASLLRGKLHSLSVVCLAANGHFLNLGRIEKVGVGEDESPYGKLIELARPDIKYGFFDLRHDNSLRSFGDGLIYIKNISASSLPKRGFF